MHVYYHVLYTILECRFAPQLPLTPFFSLLVAYLECMPMYVWDCCSIIEEDRLGKLALNVAILFPEQGLWHTLIAAARPTCL